MTNTSTQLMDIAARIRGMREILGYSTQKMAEQTEVTEVIYRQYETGTVDLPFTFLHKCAKVFGVDFRTGTLSAQSRRGMVNEELNFRLKVPVAVRIAVITIRVVGTANFTSSSVKPRLVKPVFKS